MLDAWRLPCVSTQSARRHEKQEIWLLPHALLGMKQLAVVFFVTLCFGYVYPCRGLFVSDPHLPQLPELPENISFASELVKARNDLGLTQSQLSSKSGVSLSAIKAYESGRNMPGSRELRDLCQALQVSPNKMLFGKELPFESRSIMDSLTNGESENDAVSRVRATMLLYLLASDERDSILTLARSLAIARHGLEEVKQTLLGADALTGMLRGMALASSEAVRADKPIDIEKFASGLDGFLTRQGHKPEPKKLLKK